MTRSRSLPLGRASAALVGALVVAGGFFGCGGHTDRSAAGLPCEELAFPCTWADVPSDSFRQSLALGAEAAARARSESPEAVARWLRTQPEIVEVLESPNMVVFRRSGARRVWLNWELLGQPAAPGTAAAAAAEPGERVQRRAESSLFGAARRLLPWPVTLQAQGAGGPERRGGVVGIDYDNDGSITQRDPKRALILVPDPQIHGDETDAITNLLTATPGYDFVDSVDVRRSRMADLQAFKAWNEYDLVHVAARSVSACWSIDGVWMAADSEANELECRLFIATGVAVDDTLLDGVAPDAAAQQPNADAQRSDYQRTLNDQGLEVFAAYDDAGDLEWRVFATNGFFRSVYPNGVRRAVVVLNVSNEFALTGLGDVLAGTPATSTVVMWRTARTVDEAGALAAAFYKGVSEGWSPGDVFESHLPQVQCSGPVAPRCGATAKLGVDFRIREVVSLRSQATANQPGGVLEDGSAIESLMDTPLAANPGIFVTVDVEGITPADVNIPVRLELDGRPIAERSLADATTTADVEYNISRLHFDDVPVGPEVQDGEDHELQAIVSLPRGGESRFAVTLTTIDRRCYWEAEVQGPALSGTFTGSGIRMASTDRYGVLQLDSGGLRTPVGPGGLTGITFPLGMPPAEGTFAATGSMVGMYSGRGALVGSTQTGGVNLTTLTTNPDDESRSVAGTFEAEFAGVIVNNRPVMGSTVLKGRFIGQLAGARGCGSASFRWFDAIPRAAGGGS